MTCLVIAVDGTAASGKGTLAKRLANHFQFDHLDTGLIYRKAAYFALEDQVDIHNAHDVVHAILNHDVTADIHSSLHTEEVSSAASIIAAFPEVRQALLHVQQDFPIGKKGAVVDGRDIGTVIFPNAKIKLFLTADIIIRTQRRFQQLQSEGKTVIFDDVLKNLRERDQRDTQRKVAPTIAAEDAIVIDTTNLNAESVLELAISLCHKTVTNSLQAA